MFSRRHETNELHEEAKMNRAAKAQLKQIHVDQQIERTARRTPEQIKFQRARKALKMTEVQYQAHLDQAK